MHSFTVTESALEIASLREQLLSHDAGAYASFEGWVRANNDGRAVTALTYESYHLLAETEGCRIVEQAKLRFAILDAACVHRVGTLELGELAVWVGVSAGHRDAAFAACRWIIDEVKSRVPIWKHEHYADGPAAWLHPPPADSR